VTLLSAVLSGLTGLFALTLPWAAIVTRPIAGPLLSFFFLSLAPFFWATTIVAGLSVRSRLANAFAWLTVVVLIVFYGWDRAGLPGHPGTAIKLGYGIIALGLGIPALIQIGWRRWKSTRVA
jgi:hypothetical protein